jgi:hypothetical protein
MGSFPIILKLSHKKSFLKKSKIYFVTVFQIIHFSLQVFFILIFYKVLKLENENIYSCGKNDFFQCGIFSNAENINYPKKLLTNLICLDIFSGKDSTVIKTSLF